MWAPWSQFDFNGTVNICHLRLQLLVRCLGLIICSRVRAPPERETRGTMYTSGRSLHSRMRSSSIKGESIQLSYHYPEHYASSSVPFDTRCPRGRMGNN